MGSDEVDRKGESEAGIDRNSPFNSLRRLFKPPQEEEI